VAGEVSNRWVRILGIWGGGGLVLNLLWEILQRPLYAAYRGFSTHLPGCIRASFGDLGILAVLYLLLAAVCRDLLWVRRLSPGRLFLLAAAGSLVAVVIELKALDAGGWSYGPLMAVVPGLGVGWSPLLQMILIPAGLYLLAYRSLRYRE
jgi:hypothetical protein